MNAIDTLGHYGSAAARQPLRSRFERWSVNWRGRQDKLRYNVLAKPGDQPGAAQAAIEAAYVRALGAGMGWLTGASEVTGLRALCVTAGCRSQVDALARSVGGLAKGTRFTSDLRNLDPQVAARVGADLKRLTGELGLAAATASRAPVRRSGAQPDAA